LLLLDRRELTVRAIFENHWSRSNCSVAIRVPKTVSASSRGTIWGYDTSGFTSPLRESHTLTISFPTAAEPQFHLASDWRCGNWLWGACRTIPGVRVSATARIACAERLCA